LSVGQEFEKPSGFEERSSSTEGAKCDLRELEKTEGLRVGLTGSASVANLSTDRCEVRTK